MENFENIKILITNIDLLLINFVKSTVASFIHQSQSVIKYITNIISIFHA